MAELSEREKLIRDINGLKESISFAFRDKVSKQMTGAERQELLNSIGSLEKHLDDLRTRLDRLRD